MLHATLELQDLGVATRSWPLLETVTRVGDTVYNTLRVTDRAGNTIVSSSAFLQDLKRPWMLGIPTDTALFQDLHEFTNTCSRFR